MSQRGPYTGSYTPLPADGRVVVDANVLLNAVFVADGFARNALNALRALGKTAIIDDSIDLECRCRLQTIVSELGLGQIALHQLLAMFNEGSASLLHLPGGQLPDDLSAALQHLENDIHVVAACFEHDAWLLTSDVQLTTTLLGLGRAVRTPWDVVAEAADKTGRPLDLDYTLRSVRPSSKEGFIFARVFPGDWVGVRDKGKNIVCDIEGIGRLLYERQGERWVFECFDTSTAKMMPLRCGQLVVVCGTYKFRTPHKGHISVFAGEPGGVVFPSSSPARSPRAFTPRTLRYGGRVGGEDEWYGCLQFVATGPQAMTQKHFNSLLSIPNAMPDPHDWKMLETVIAVAARNRTRDGRLVFPSESSIVRYGR